MRRYTIELFLGRRETNYGLQESYSLPICSNAREVSAIANADMDRGEWTYIRTFKDSHSADYWRTHGIVPKY